MSRTFWSISISKNQHAIWFHCVSVGETNAAQPLIEHYLKAGHAVLVTNTTKTGQARQNHYFKSTVSAAFSSGILACGSEASDC